MPTHSVAPPLGGWGARALLGDSLQIVEEGVDNDGAYHSICARG